MIRTRRKRELDRRTNRLERVDGLSLVRTRGIARTFGPAAIVAEESVSVGPSMPRSEDAWIERDAVSAGAAPAIQAHH